jgi:hypothetical protein
MHSSATRALNKLALLEKNLALHPALTFSPARTATSLATINSPWPTPRSLYHPPNPLGFARAESTSSFDAVAASICSKGIHSELYLLQNRAEGG